MDIGKQRRVIDVEPEPLTTPAPEPEPAAPRRPEPDRQDQPVETS